MKTDYPDLERSENVSFWKHLLNWLWNKPRRIAEELYFQTGTMVEVRQRNDDPLLYPKIFRYGNQSFTKTLFQSEILC